MNVFTARRVGRSVSHGFESLETRVVPANPTASSIVADPSQPGANVDNPRFVVTFSEAVTAVDPADFVAVTGPGVIVAPGPMVVTGSGTTYTVTVNGVSGVGTQGLHGGRKHFAGSPSPASGCASPRVVRRRLVVSFELRLRERLRLASGTGPFRQLAP